MKLKNIRRLSGAVFFTLLTLMFLDFTGTLHHFLSWMAKMQLLPALLSVNAVAIAFLVVLTLVFGRIYCSVICPLGIFQDLVAHVHSRRKKFRYTYSKAVSWLRYSFLGIMTVSFVLGLSAIVSILDPYAAFGRMATMIFQPIYKFANNLLAIIAEHADSYAFYTTEVWMKSLATLIVSVATLLVVGFLAWRGGRTYCNTVCPVGTLLGMLSRFSLLKVRIDTDKCNACSLCSRNCKASCIDFKNHKIDYSRCVTCGNCLATCKHGALSYGLAKAKEGTNSHTNNEEKDIDKSRRAFLVGAGIATTSALLAQEKKTVDGGLARIEDKVQPTRRTPITPPGSLSAQNMAKHCTACQLCVSECPNDVLRPQTTLDHFMQPTSSYERGYCRPECNRCSEVCPTGAIRPINRADKSAVQIGQAHWIKNNCLPVRKEISCGNCARHCPAGAIKMVPLDPNDDTSPMVPSVIESRCIGCGACEYVCPSRPFPAIYVEGNEVHHEI